MSTFRVGLSAGFKQPDGSPAYPSFDLSPLDDEPRIEWYQGGHLTFRAHAAVRRLVIETLRRADLVV